MPEINNLFFSHREVIELLIKQANIHEGKWILALDFGITPGNFGPTEDKFSPGVVVMVNRVGLTRAAPDAPKEQFVDAEVSNPKPQSARKKS